MLLDTKKYRSYFESNLVYNLDITIAQNTTKVLIITAGHFITV